MRQMTVAGLRLRAPNPMTLLGPALLVFVAACFLLPSSPAYALAFYVIVAPLALARAIGGHGATVRDRGYALATALIYWSGATLLWGRDDGHRWALFALDAVMTGLFVDTLMWVLREPAPRARLATVMVWTGTANATLSVGLGLVLPQATERLHGWGITTSPILGPSVTSVAFLAAMVRALTGRRGRIGYLAACACMLGYVLMTQSRGPLLALALATLFLLASGPWRWQALGLLAVPAVGWALLPPALRRHIEAEVLARGASHRPEIWRRTLRMVADHPLLGNGLAANLDLPQMTFPHDLYLSVLFYSGAVGLALFAALLGEVVLRLWRARPGPASAAWVRPDWLWTVSALISALVSGLTDLGQITKGPGPMWFIVWLPVCLALSRRPPLALAPALTPRGAAARLRP